LQKIRLIIKAIQKRKVNFMSTAYWGFYIHISGMKIGSSASVGSAGTFGVQGPTYNWGGAGQGGCYFAINYKESKRIYNLDIDFVSIQGQGFIRPAMEQKDDIGDVPWGEIWDARFSLEVHEFRSRGCSWLDVPTNLKLTAANGAKAGKKERIVVERNQLISLKGAADTPAIVRGRLSQTSFNEKLWDACFGRDSQD
jgi:hypothetical protein